MSSEADNILEIYERHAEAYDRLRGRSLFERVWLDRLLALLPPRPRILDIGCGHGEPIARYFIERESESDLTGIDSSTRLIALCRERFPGQAWHVADMRRLALDATFEGLVAWDSFFHLGADDQRAMFDVFRRHAAPQSALLFTSGPAAGEAIGSFEGEPLYHASLDPAEYRSLLDAAGFRVVSHVRNDPDCGGHTIWLAQRR